MRTPRLPAAPSFALTAVALLLAGAPPAPARADDAGTRGGVRLALRVDTPVVHEGDSPRITLTFVNDGNQPVRVAAPLDGSWDHMRQPHYTAEYLDATGAVVPRALGAPGGRCGNTNALDPARDIATVPPHGALDAARIPGIFPYDELVQPSARPGTWQLRVRYEASMPGATPLSLVSNTATITVAGGSEALWRCYRDVDAHAHNAVHTTVRPLGVAPWESGYALLYAVVREGTVASAYSHSAALFVQRLDGGAQPAGAPVPIPLPASAAGGQLVAVDRALLALVGTQDSRGARAARAVVLRGAGAALAVARTAVLSENLASPYHLALAAAPGGSGARALYYTAQGAGAGAALVLQRFAADGAVDGAPRALATVAAPSGARLGAGAASGEQLVLYADGPNGLRVLRIGPDGAPRGAAVAVTPALRGEPAGVRATARGFTVAYNRNETTERDRTPMGLYTLEIDARGARVGRPTALSVDPEGAPNWGVVDFAGGAAVRANETGTGARRAGRYPVRVLEAAALGRPAAALSRTYAGDLAYAPSGAAARVLAWSDERDDASAVCQRVGECVGEAYVAVLDARGAVQLAPTRVTRLAAPRTAPDSVASWQALCGPPATGPQLAP